MTQLEKGKTIFVRYQGHDLWHERLVLAAVGSSGSQYIILTPDDDLYLEDYGRANRDIDGVKKATPQGGLPRGIGDGESYRFRSLPTGRELQALFEDAEAEAENEMIRNGNVADPPAPGVPSVWIALEKVGNIAKGQEVTLTNEDVVVESRAIHSFTIEGKTMQVSCGKVAIAVKKEFVSNLVEEPEDDARTLTIRTLGNVRFRQFKEAVELMSQVDFKDWPVPGPRTVMWCLTFLVRRGGPQAHHQWWVSINKLQLGDAGVSEHENCMKAVEDGVQYDQCDATNLAVYEHVLRKAQLWEFYHKEKTRSELAAQKSSVIDLEEQQIFMGSAGAEGSLMICPTLTEWVGKELEKIANVDKQSRKAREERALRRK